MQIASPESVARTPPSSQHTRARGIFVASVNVYDSPPHGDVALEEFETFAIDRLQVLRKIDDGRLSRKPEEQLQDRVRVTFNQAMKGESMHETNARDVISHFVLRLAFCQTEDLRRWFLTQECELFTWRFNAMPSHERVMFLKKHFDYEEISNTEFKKLKSKLASVFRSLLDNSTAVAVMNEEYRMFYKVPFECVPELVSRRKVFLHKGFAFVPRDQVVSLVVGHFRSRISKALTLLAHRWSSVIAPQEKERLVPIVEALKTQYVGPTYEAGSSGGTELHGIPSLAKNSFPLCMQHLYEQLNQNNHLRHMGRQQLSLFLKGIGLSLGDSLQFWKQAFMPRISGDKFEKEYGYGIRHTYGKEGKRKDYSPYPCVKIVSFTPGVGEHHGCPYKTFGETQLRAKLGKMQMEHSFVAEVIGKARGGHYQLACAAAFEGMHKCPCDTGINHPNQYFEESQKLNSGQCSDRGMDLDQPTTPRQDGC